MNEPRKIREKERVDCSAFYGFAFMCVSLFVYYCLDLLEWGKSGTIRESNQARV